ncbi:hypothetical protein [Nonomuraea cavernae]|uniref:Sensor domain-containing protein n=1 Tax=Nonomuraea cavernae TaxID=2045107 RepID=A0A918DH55_9ACTN|nr:hypothetical protein [Nonomuraea cavernae]MCA2185376.1 hypothetical protein [Nonomuraea cavernae]GGO66280.1 hypothetical protein GCM10012289_19910 [Nonomuraea cavernae]
MKRGLRITGLVVACGLVSGLLIGCLVGCGSEATEGHADPRALAALRGALGTPARLPDGFAPRPQDAWRAPFTAANRNCRVLLAPVGGRAPERALTAQAAVSYQGDELGEQVGVGLARYVGSEAEGHIDDLATALSECRKVRSRGGTRLRLRELPLQDVGDEAIGAELRGKLNGYPYALDVVLARSGDTLVSLVHTGMAGVDRERTRQLLTAVMGMASA